MSTCLIFSDEDQPEVGMYAALDPVGAQSKVHIPHSAHHRVVLNREQLSKFSLQNIQYLALNYQILYYI